MALSENFITSRRQMPVAFAARVHSRTLELGVDRDLADLCIRIFLSKNIFKLGRILFDIRHRFTMIKVAGDPGKDKNICDRLINLLRLDHLNNSGNVDAAIANAFGYRPGSEVSKGVANNEDFLGRL